MTTIGMMVGRTQDRRSAGCRRAGRLVTATGRDGTWIAFAVWALVFLAIPASLAGLPRSA